MSADPEPLPASSSLGTPTMAVFLSIATEFPKLSAFVGSSVPSFARCSQFFPFRTKINAEPEVSAPALSRGDSDD